MTGEHEFQRRDFPDMVKAFRKLGGTPRFEITHSVENGDWISVRLRVEADRPLGLPPIKIHGQMMTRFEGQVMVQSYTTFDYLSLFEQLGQIRPDALALGMSGEKLTWT